MNILYIHQYFTTPNIGGGTRSYEFSKYFLVNGHSVTMITSHNSKIAKYENIEGINVIWLPNFYRNEMGIVLRLISYFKFMIKSILVSIKQKDIDICLATSTPLTVGITAIIVKKIKKIPFIFEVRDLWPEFPIQMGVIRSKILQQFAYFIEKKIYQQSQSIIALSPGMADGVKRYNLNKKISVIPNSADLNLFFPHEPSLELISKYKIKNKFIIIYFGTLGRANGVDYIIQAAKILNDKKYNDIHFIIVGKGQQEETLINMKKEFKLNNVAFLGFLPKSELAELVNNCHATITTFIDIPILYTNSPNKLFDSLSAGKVCFVNSDGWTRELLEENDCGFYVDPKNPAEFVQKIIFIRNNLEIRRKMEINARNLAIKKFDRKTLAKKVLVQLENYAK